MARTTNYSKDRDTLENYNDNDKYSETGESEFSRESTIPFDQDEVLSERHYNLEEVENRGQRYLRRREEIARPKTRQQNFRGRGPKGYRRSDEAIKDDVSERLFQSMEVDASYIEVTVNEGHVRLQGTVSDRFQKKMAEITIDNVSGVIDVYNELRIDDSVNKPGKHGLMNNITGMN